MLPWVLIVWQMGVILCYWFFHLAFLVEHVEKGGSIKDFEPHIKANSLMVLGLCFVWPGFVFVLAVSSLAKTALKKVRDWLKK